MTTFSGGRVSALVLLGLGLMAVAGFASRESSSETIPGSVRRMLSLKHKPWPKEPLPPFADGQLIAMVRHYADLYNNGSDTGLVPGSFDQKMEDLVMTPHRRLRALARHLQETYQSWWAPWCLKYTHGNHAATNPNACAKAGNGYICSYWSKYTNNCSPRTMYKIFVNDASDTYGLFKPINAVGCIGQLQDDQSTAVITCPTLPNDDRTINYLFYTAWPAGPKPDDWVPFNMYVKYAAW
eukprot:TRINITY_DN38868_c0_g1_i1.p1 TRINITY_DN38868_c0_g1~~TRINITY_DN38868_c0_g1_i1.p1  ORF type:complete len:239 (-),score=6.89 TRINITY_DN38868_c0_g1_i1:520-1236(-)